MIKFIKNIKTKSLSDSLEEGLINHALIQEYIEGEEYNGEQLSTFEEQKIVYLIEEFHKRGYADLDIREDNFILTPKKELYFVDLGLIRKRSKSKNFKNLKKRIFMI